MASKSGVLGVVLVGSEGRMGRAIATAIEADPHYELVGRLDRDLAELPSPGGHVVVLDFSCDEGTNDAIIAAEKLETPILVGTTGLATATKKRIEQLSERLPVALISNTSMGVALMEHLAREICHVLPGAPTWQVEIEETHHAGKRDAPSGTAIFLANVCSKSGMGVPLDTIRSIRRDDVVGEHEVRFSSSRESLILRHEAHDRSLFAAGALLLGRRLFERDPGVYAAADLFRIDSKRPVS